jgi:hypothetical protein
MSVENYIGSINTVDYMILTFDDCVSEAIQSENICRYFFARHILSFVRINLVVIIGAR